MLESKKELAYYLNSIGPQWSLSIDFSIGFITRPIALPTHTLRAGLLRDWGGFKMEINWGVGVIILL
jgi:hypothetical protein